MKSDLFLDLMRFAMAKTSTRERLRYVILGLTFYTFLARTMVAGMKGSDSASSSQAGDDIYPLF